MFSYWRIVFGLKPYLPNGRIKDVLKKCACSFVIYQQCEIDNDGCWCGRPNMHFHGLLEVIDGNEWRVQKIIGEMREYCLYVSYAPCSMISCFLASFAQQTVFINFWSGSGLPKYLQEITSERYQEQKNRMLLKKGETNNRSSNIRNVIICVMGTGINDLKTIVKCCRDEAGKALNNRDINNECEIALRISRKIILEQHILSLSEKFKIDEDYLSLEASVNFVKDWCLYQNVNIKEFVNSWILCLDKKCVNRCCIYLHGAPNSGKSYITKSIAQACVFVGMVVAETTGYAYFWEKCIDKRLIVLFEPHFDAEKNLDVLETVLSGSGALITRSDGSMDYLQSTPVVILTNNHVWDYHPELKQKISNKFAYSCMDLKQFPAVPVKKLHPGWLNVVNSMFNATCTGDPRITD